MEIRHLRFGAAEPSFDMFAGGREFEKGERFDELPRHAPWCEGCCVGESVTLCLPSEGIGLFI